MEQVPKKAEKARFVQGMAQQTDIINDFWKELCEEVHGTESDSIFDLPFKTICDFLVRQRVATDRQKARAMILHEVTSLISEDKLSKDEFLQLFCRGMFKGALLRISDNFELSLNKNKSMKNSKDHIALGNKIDTF